MKHLSTKALVVLAGLFAGSFGFAADAPAKYQSSCFACHGTGVPGAAKAGDTAAWAPKVEKGIETLIASVKNGKGAMPPTGLCADCTDAEYQELIEYMSGHKF